jgi:hypothetical protein
LVKDKESQFSKWQVESSVLSSANKEKMSATQMKIIAKKTGEKNRKKGTVVSHLITKKTLSQR